MIFRSSLFFAHEGKKYTWFYIGLRLEITPIAFLTSKKDKLFELKQFEKEPANLNRFKDEISIFKELIFEKFAWKSEQLVRPARNQNKSP